MSVCSSVTLIIVSGLCGRDRAFLSDTFVQSVLVKRKEVAYAFVSWEIVPQTCPPVPHKCRLIQINFNGVLKIRKSLYTLVLMFQATVLEGECLEQQTVPGAKFSSGCVGLSGGTCA